MSDIVERLRQPCLDVSRHLAIEAADEIVRLRAENVALRQAALTHVKAENAIRAERDKLRDALKQVSMACDTYGEDQSFGDMLTVRRIQDLARAALGDTP